MILFLGPLDDITERVVRFLSRQESLILESDLIDIPFLDRHRPDFIVSYNYRHKISSDVLQLIGKGNAINLHIAYLPFNRGCHPNFWSWLLDTPKGVTVHEIDEGWDTGDILWRTQGTLMYPDETFRKTFERLHDVLFHMFTAQWSQFRNQRFIPQPQEATTTLHMRKDLERYWPHFDKGWDSRIDQVLSRIAESEMSTQFVEKQNVEMR